MFKTIAFAAALVAASVLSAGMAHAQANYGFDVQKTKADPNEGVTEGDFYTLVNNALGSNFGSLVMVFGGCYSGGFASGLANSQVGKSGKPVAVLTATNRNNPDQCTPAGIHGAPFFKGVIGGFVDISAGGVTNPVSSAFSAGDASVQSFTYKEAIKKKLNDEAETDETKLIVVPSQPDKAWVNGGDKITLDGKDKDHKHAILFMGKPQTVFDWNDLVTAYQTLVDAGYEDIRVFFGTGEAKDGFPLLTNDDFTPGVSVQQDSSAYVTPRPINVLTDITKDGKVSGIIHKAADFEHLKDTLRTWKAISKLAGHADDQFFFAVGTHSTNAATGRAKKDLEFETAVPATATPKNATGGVQPPKKKGKAAQVPLTIGIGIDLGGGAKTDSADHASAGKKPKLGRPADHPSCLLGAAFC